MKNFEFKSAICTSKEQSERLLALGLKKETADMCWQKTTLNGEVITYPAQDVWHYSTAITNFHIPAWSLHRLLEILFNGTSESIKRLLKFGYQELNYDMVITLIEDLVNLKQFNKDYLEEK